MADWDSISFQYDRIFLESPLYIDTIRMLISSLECGDGAVSGYRVRNRKRYSRNP